MAKSSGVLHPPKTRRFEIPKAAEGETPMFSLRLPAETRDAVDKWAAAQEDKPGRSEAIRRLLNRQLAVEPEISKPGRKRKARKVL
jgi:hypothetical protein